jgi:large subunit ribosomal protein L3
MSETTETVLPIKSILAQKVGMTQIFDTHGNIVPVTVLQAGPCSVVNVRRKATHGYEAVQLGFGSVKEKNLVKPKLGYFKKQNVAPVRWLREVRVTDAAAFQPGQVITTSIFQPGQLVDVRGFSKGHGFSGAMKRHNFGGGPRTHGQSDRPRAVGSIGSNTYPGRVFKGKKMPGHYGAEWVTVQHMEVVQVIPEKNLLLIKGGVPGLSDNYVVVQETVKKKKFITVRASEKKDKKKDAGKAPAAKAKGK